MLRNLRLLLSLKRRAELQDFSGSPEVKNPPCHAGFKGSIPGQGDKILYATEQLSLCATTPEPMRSGACVPQLENLCAVMKDPTGH